MIGEWWCIGDTCWLTWFDEYHGIFVHLGEPMIFGSTYYYFSLAASREWKPPGFQLKWKASFGEESNYLTLTGWWFQPIWKIWSSKWESSPSKGEHKNNIWVATTQFTFHCYHGDFFHIPFDTTCGFSDRLMSTSEGSPQPEFYRRSKNRKKINAFQVRIKKSEHILHPNHLKWSQTSTKHANISMNWLVVSTHLKNMVGENTKNIWVPTTQIPNNSPKQPGYLP